MQIVRTSRYLEDMKRIGATSADARKLEAVITASPTVGDVIPGMGGLRKLRFGIGNRGKRGGGRAIYFLMIGKDTTALLRAHDKQNKTT